MLYGRMHKSLIGLGLERESRLPVHSINLQKELVGLGSEVGAGFSLRHLICGSNPCKDA